MILTCPDCHAQFKVKASLIPEEGREVRCASCKHVWHAYPEGEFAELTPPEPKAAEAEAAADEVSRLIAFPDPEPTDEPDDEPPAPPERPEDAFTGDADSLQDNRPAADALPDLELKDEPELISAIEEEDADAAFAMLADEHADEDDTPKIASSKPLIAVAACLVLLVFATALFALPAAMQGPFGFVYAMMGAHSSQGLVLENLQLRERPSRSKARYILEGDIVNKSDEARHVPIWRIAMIDRDGKLMQQREFKDSSDTMIAPGERFSFKASNLETSSKDALSHFVIDIGHGGELRLRKPTDGAPHDG